MKLLVAANVGVLVLACLLSPAYAQYYGPTYPAHPAYMPGYQPVMPVSAAMPMAQPMPMMVLVPVPVHTTKMLGPVENMPKEGPPVPHIPDPPAKPGWFGKMWHKMAGKK